MSPSARSCHGRFITARREGIDWLRRQKNAPICLDNAILELLEQEWADEAAAGDIRGQALRDCLEDLPSKSRDLLKRRYFDGHACEAVAEATRRPARRDLQTALPASSGLEKVYRNQGWSSRPAELFQKLRLSEEQNELLLRHLNGQLGPDEEAKVADLLRGNAEARAFLRAVAEQAVVVADVERLDQHKPQTVKVITPVFFARGSGRLPLRRRSCCCRRS